MFGVEPEPWQAELLTALAKGERRISVRSGHGVGKTTAVAWCIVWILLCKFPQKTVCTAPTSAQLFDALAAEAKAWLGKLPPALQELFEVKSDRIELRAAPQESFVSFRTSSAEKPEAMAGIHSENVYLFADEASGIPEAIFEAGAGSMSGHTATTCLTGNPVRTTGLFFDTHHKLRDLWRTIKVSCLDVPHRVSADFVEDMRRRYGERSNAYRVRVLGEFPLGDDDTVIPLELVEAALDREVEPFRHKPVWGVDCKRFGNDANALAKRKGNVLLEPVLEKRDGGMDTMQWVGLIKAEWDRTAPADRPVSINIDSIGIGGGVCDRLRELGLPARGINVSESPAVGEKYLNLRAELWFKGLDWFLSRDCNIAKDEGLAKELVIPRFKYTSGGKLQVESKEEMKKRGFPSPNKADAFLLTFATPAVMASGGIGGLSSWATPLKRALKSIV